MVTVKVTLKRTLGRTVETHVEYATKTLKLAATAGAEFTVVLPVSAIDGCLYGPGGDENVTVVVDSTNVVPEWNEGNNSAIYTLP